MEEDRRTKDMAIDLDGEDNYVDLISQVPLLKNIPSWRKYYQKIDRNKLCRYIVYLYSHDSYLNKVRTPLDERRKKATLHAGFKMDAEGNFEWDVIEFLWKLKSPEIFDMIHDFLRVQNEATWNEIVITETELDEATRIRLSPLAGESKKALELKTALRESSAEMNAYLDGLYRKFYLDNTDVKNRKRATTIESLAKNLVET